MTILRSGLRSIGEYHLLIPSRCPTEPFLLDLKPNIGEPSISMSEDLRKRLGKSKVESQIDPDSPWKPGVWSAAVKALEAGWRPAEPRYPVVINTDGPLDTAEKLQKLADLPSVPEVSKTRATDLFGAYDGEEVYIADVTWHQRLLLEKRTEQDDRVIVWFPDAVTKKPTPRSACVVKSIKEEFRGTETGLGGQDQGTSEGDDTDVGRQS